MRRRGGLRATADLLLYRVRPADRIIDGRGVIPPKGGAHAWHLEERGTSGRNTGGGAGSTNGRPASGDAPWFHSAALAPALSRGPASGKRGRGEGSPWQMKAPQ